MSTKISTRILFEDFMNHLNKSNRIFFSAKYGSGKSTFLNEFFDNYSNNYEIFKLYPVNYSIASNEDIFEFIKSDLALEVLLRSNEKKIELENDKFGNSILLHRFLLDYSNSPETIFEFFEMLEKLNKDESSELTFIIGSALQKLATKFKKYKTKKQLSHYDMFIEFLNGIEAKRGSSFEFDSISKILKIEIEKIKTSSKFSETDNPKNTILVIDDLDRLDPDHIFRILNIFSAHYSDVGDDNKFGFDKIILVGDIQNIKSIFQHKYGINTDFLGYINKFYTNKPYEFNVGKIMFNNHHLLFSDLTNDNNDEFDYFTYILNFLFVHKILNFRDIVKREIIPRNVLNCNLNGHIIYENDNDIFYLYHLFRNVSIDIFEKLSILESKIITNNGNEISRIPNLFLNAIIFVINETPNKDCNLNFILDNFSYEVSFRVGKDNFDKISPKIEIDNSQIDKLNSNIILKTILKAIIKLDSLSSR